MQVKTVFFLYHNRSLRNDVHSGEFNLQKTCKSLKIKAKKAQKYALKSQVTNTLIQIHSSLLKLYINFQALCISFQAFQQMFFLSCTANCRRVFSYKSMGWLNFTIFMETIISSILQLANLLTLYLVTFTKKERGRFAGYKFYALFLSKARFSSQLDFCSQDRQKRRRSERVKGTL